MPGFLATYRSRNLLFCLELSLSPLKTRHMRAVSPCIDAALNQTWKVQAVFFKLNCSWQFPFKSSIKTPSSWLKNLVIISLQPTSLCLIHYFSNHQQFMIKIQRKSAPRQKFGYNMIKHFHKLIQLSSQFSCRIRICLRS